jgi:S1-C subfamily serine protease
MNGTTTSTAPPRLSRETRRLLMAVALSLVALWVLARVRFPDRPATPIAGVLSQLSTSSTFADLSAEVARLRGLLAPWLTSLPESVGDSPRRVAVRLDTDSAVTYMHPSERREVARTSGLDVLALDSATGLAIVRVSAGQPGFVLVPWLSARINEPRYLVAALPEVTGVSFTPVFVSGMTPVMTPGWSGPVWQLPASIDFSGGSLIFSINGELAGMVVHEAGMVAIVPADTLLADARRLQARGSVTEGDLGIMARPLTPALASATGARHGVIVAWAAPPGAAHVAMGDVIESLNGVPVTTLREWEVRSSRLVAGETVQLDVRREGKARHLTLAAVPQRARGPGGLGLALRSVRDVGSEILSVEPGSAAAHAGLMAGDIITAAGRTLEPTPDDLEDVFSRTRPGQSILLGITRNKTRDVVALSR